MFRTIMVPVDLAHLPQITKAIDTAGDLARHYGAGITFVAITAETPTSVAHNPKEFAAKLDDFARLEAARLGVNVTAKSYPATDPTIDVDQKLAHAVMDCGADLVVMASHKPNMADYFWAAHGTTLAAHTDVSVFLVR